MNIAATIRAKIRADDFLPGWTGAIWNPCYIIRAGLYRAISEYAPTLQGRILDFGCGSKPYERLFSSADSYTGVDIAVSGHGHSDSKIDFFYDGKTLPFSNGEFDAVVSFEVLEHVFNLPEIISEINRVTKPGGHLFITIPFAWEEHEIPYDCARYTSYGISHILQQHGYAVLRAKKTTSYILAIGQLLIAYIVGIGPSRSYLKALVQLGIVFPCTVLAIAVNALLPKRYNYFSNCAILAKKL